MTLHLGGQLVNGRSLETLAEPLMTRLIGPLPQALAVAAPSKTSAEKTAPRKSRSAA